MGFGDDDRIKEAEKRDWQKALLPLVGLILIATAAAIAWALTDVAYDFLLSNVDGVPADSDEMRLVVGGVLFFIVVMFYSLIYAAIAPKPKATISESELDREKQQKIKEEMRRKKRQKEMKKKLKQQNRS